MVTAPWRIEYDGYIFGDGTNSNVVEEIEGLNEYSIRGDTHSRVTEHGGYAFGAYLETRSIVMTGKMWADTNTNLETALDTFRSKFRPVSVIAPLRFTIPGMGTRRVYAIPSRFHASFDRYRAHAQFVEWTAEFIAGDPRIYADDAGILNGSGTVNNTGTIGTYPSATIVGPATNPMITNTTTGEYLQFSPLTVTSAQTLTLDFLYRTAKVAGSSRYGLITGGSIWFDLDPGVSTITYSGGGTFQFVWRSAWI